MDEKDDPAAIPDTNEIPKVRALDAKIYLHTHAKGMTERQANLRWGDIASLHNTLVNVFDAFNLLDKSLSQRAQGQIEEADKLLHLARIESAEGMNSLLTFSEAIATRLIDSARDQPNTEEVK